MNFSFSDAPSQHPAIGTHPCSCANLTEPRHRSWMTGLVGLETAKWPSGNEALILAAGWLAAAG
jgi:hypothetical protein